MSLIMSGHIDAVFRSIPLELRYESAGGYVDGIWVDGASVSINYVANIQPLNDREIDNLLRAGERIVDGRKVYINDGDLASLRLGQDMFFDGQLWKIIRSDVREWRRYSKTIVSRYDQQ